MLGKASTRAQNRYIAKVYDRVSLVLPKGKKEIVTAHAKNRGESLNAFINRAIDRTIEEDQREKKG